MARDHFNPAEFRHDSLHEIQQLQRRNSDFAVTNFGEFPRANNQITNICSPDGVNKPILPNCRLVNLDDLGAKISNHVAQSIAQTGEQIDLGSVQKLHDKRGTTRGDRNAGSRKVGSAGPGAPPLHDSYQDETPARPISSQNMPPSEVPQYSAPRDSTSQYDAERADEPQHETSPNRGGTQERGRGEAGSATTDSTERSYSSENPPIHTGNPTDLTIAGPPTISPQTIDAVLAAHDSPVTGYGQEIFDRCVAGGIDPAIALAFFACESTFGTDGIAVDTKSWGNIRSTDGSGGFKSYPSYMDGLQDWIGLMNDLYVAPPEQGGFGFTTADEALTKYAPPSENDTNGYANKVATLVSEWRGEEAARPKDDTKELSDVVDQAKKIVGTAGGIAKDALQKMFFTQFLHPNWNSYGDAPLSSSNCGPASFAMALRVLGIQPGAANLYGDPNPLVSEVRTLMTGYDNPDEGTKISQVVTAAKNLGLSTALVNNTSDIDKALDSGEPVVLGGDPIAYNTGMSGDEYATHPDAYGNTVVFTGGHVISVVGRNNDGTYVVMDPAYKGGILTLSQSQLAGYMAPGGAGAGVALGKTSNL